MHVDRETHLVRERTVLESEEGKYRWNTGDWGSGQGIRSALGISDFNLRTRGTNEGH